MKRILIAFIALASLAHAAEAKRAQCTVFDRHDRSQRLMAFEVDDAKYPYILKINGVDEGASQRKLIDIPLYDESQGRFETWYLGRVERTMDRQRSIYRMHFGEMALDTRQVDDRSNYSLYMDWENGTAGWLDEGMAFNLYDVVEKKPQLVVWPASCRRLD
ncbi:hypothetical protein C3Y89_24555 [Rhizobium sp. UPM1132]|uniref:hypothetical protein n=1 Tax=Rhizobium ruizarguesonis TaxID=2081791 RepID=UPI001444E5D1|nr:hypothetical protein [Rhizobium ruizarguesonis]NKQ73469.1 hypothetical protein [Rhizobium ruizarguesonis]